MDLIQSDQQQQVPFTIPEHNNVRGKQHYD